MRSVKKKTHKTKSMETTLFLTWSLVLYLLIFINLIHYEWITESFPCAGGGNIRELISEVGFSSSILKDFLYWSVEFTGLLQLQTFIFQYSEEVKYQNLSIFEI